MKHIYVSRYQVSYTKDDDSIATSWFPVSLITSDCRAIENEKRSKIGSKRVKIDFKSKFHLANISDQSTPKEKTSNISKKVSNVNIS